MPGPRVPLTDGQGLISAEWFRWFAAKERDASAAVAGEITTAPGSGLSGGGIVADGISLEIAPNGVENGMIRQSLATSIIGRFQGSAGDVADIQATADNRIFGRFGGILAFKDISAIPATVADDDYGDVTVSGAGLVWTIDAGVVTNAKLATQAQATIKGRAAAAGTGTVTDLTAGQVWAILATTTQAITASGLTQTTARLLGRTTASTGAVEEISINPPLTFTGGTLGFDGTAWTTYTPTVAAGAGAFTTVAANGAYKQIGKTVFVRITVTITVNGTANTNFTVTAPVASVNSAAADKQVLAGIETQVTGFMARGQLNNNSSTISVTKYDNTYLGADGYVINLTGCYESV